MSVTQGKIVCLDDCSFDIPAVSFADCNPEVNLSQIAKIYMAQPDAAGFTDWTLAGEWVSRISSDSTDVDAIRAITVIADKPIPETTSKTISGNRIVVTDKKHTINFDVDESNVTNHEFARGGKCIRQVKMWYETIGGLLFGGNSGIDATFTIDMNLSRSEGDIILYQGNLKWSSTDLEERTTSPIV